MDIKSLKSLLKVLREYGVTSYDTADLKLCLGDLSASPTPLPATLEDFSEPSEEDLLFYSTPATSIPDKA